MSVGMSDEFMSFDQQAVIKVCGVGGGGGNAVNRMISEGLKGVEFISVNTDAQALKHSPAATRLQIGPGVTGGLGSGARPEVGRRAAEEDLNRIKDELGDANMVFLTAGMGGGTGTGASPLIAEASRASGALTVAIVTMPFSFEGPERMKNAIKGLEELEPHVDTLIVIPNDRVAELSTDNVSFMEAFRQADEVLHNGVRAISELITVPGLVNLDFADVCTIMEARGRALMGIGRAEGENRAVRAAEEAMICPLLEQSSINGASSVIVNVKGGCDIRMREITEAVSTVQKAARPGANIIFGAVVTEQESPEIQVTVIATGFPPGATETFDVDTAKAKIEAKAMAREQAAAAAPAPLAPKAEDKTPHEIKVSSKPAPEPSTEESPFPEPVLMDDGEQADLFGEGEPAAAVIAESESVDFDTPTFVRKRGASLPRWMAKRRGGE